VAAFGRDFQASAAGARMIYRLPLLLDAANLVAQRKGDAFMAEFGAAMTGVKPKTTFLKPGVALPMAIEVVRQIFKQKIWHSSPNADDSYKARAREDTPRITAFQRGGLRDGNA
jgi:hypothetical protein